MFHCLPLPVLLHLWAGFPVVHFLVYIVYVSTGCRLQAAGKLEVCYDGSGLVRCSLSAEGYALVGCHRCHRLAVGEVLRGRPGLMAGCPGLMTGRPRLARGCGGGWCVIGGVGTRGGRGRVGGVGRGRGMLGVAVLGAEETAENKNEKTRVDSSMTISGHTLTPVSH